MKYQNTSGFRQVVIIEGKKEVVFADDVIEVKHPLINAAFEKVADSTPVTFKARSLKKPSNSEEKVSLVDIESKIDEVKKEATNITSEAISRLAESTESHSSDLSSLREEFSEFKLLTVRRLEILKNAVMTLEYEVGQLYPDEEGNEEKESFRT